MSLRGNIETYTLEQKIEGYKLFSDTSYRYRIRNRENMLVSFCQVSGSCSKEPVIFKPYNVERGSMVQGSTFRVKINKCETAENIQPLNAEP